MKLLAWQTESLLAARRRSCAMVTDRADRKKGIADFSDDASDRWFNILEKMIKCMLETKWED